MAAVSQRRALVFGLVLFAGLLATSFTALAMGLYLRQKIDSSTACQEGEPVPEICTGR
jgi:hypothetical protein